MKKHDITLDNYFLTIYEDENRFFAVGSSRYHVSIESCAKEVVKALKAQEEEEEEFEPFDDDWNDYQDFDSGMTEREQIFSDRADYANERLRRGEIDEEQAAEIRMGA